MYITAHISDNQLSFREYFFLACRKTYSFYSSFSKQYGSAFDVRENHNVWVRRSYSRLPKVNK